ncbi:MAG: GNAT family N-acetyltransferase, partial [Planctomycetes bacterium]|nr:GNAT family N-acetyltransferase [Planctomycetota bacterium]
IDWSHKRTEIGYWLDELYQGRGIMTRAVNALMTYGFEELKLNAIRIRCATGNAASRAIPERLGFAHEGTARQWECLYGVYHDSEGYSMLASEWKERYGQKQRKSLSSNSSKKRKVSTGKIATGKVPRSRAAGK